MEMDKLTRDEMKRCVDDAYYTGLNNILSNIQDLEKKNYSNEKILRMIKMTLISLIERKDIFTRTKC